MWYVIGTTQNKINKKRKDVHVMKRSDFSPSPTPDDLPIPYSPPAHSQRVRTLWLAVLAVGMVCLSAALLLGMGSAGSRQSDDDTPSAPSNPTSSSLSDDAGRDLPKDFSSSTRPPEPGADDAEDFSASPLPEELTQTSPSEDLIDSAKDDASEDAEKEAVTVIVEQIVLSGSADLVYQSYSDGNCMVIGIGNCRDRCLVIPTRSPTGETVIAIGSEAFLGCEFLEAVQIPATVKTIGTRAFGNCPRIVQFCVDSNSSAFCAVDGVLYSKDMTSLLSYPAGRGCPSAAIPASVTYISAMAFASTMVCRHISYAGDIAAWRKITIGDGNDLLYTLSKQFGAS